jgi:hypothetical protein
MLNRPRKPVYGLNPTFCPKKIRVLNDVSSCS